MEHLPTQLEREAARQEAIDNRQPTYVDSYLCTVGHVSARYRMSKVSVQCLDDSVLQQRGHKGPSIIQALKKSATNLSTQRARKNADHFTEGSLLKVIKSRQLAVTKIKKRRVMTVDQYCAKHRLEYYEERCNGDPFEF